MNIYGAHTRAPALAHRVRESERGRVEERGRKHEKECEKQEKTHSVSVYGIGIVIIKQIGKF